MLLARHKVCLELEMYFVCIHILSVLFFVFFFVPMCVHYFPPSLFQHFSGGLMLPALYALVFCF